MESMESSSGGGGTGTLSVIPEQFRNRKKCVGVTTGIFGIGKRHALKKYDQFALNTSCYWESSGSKITLVVQFHEIFVQQ